MSYEVVIKGGLVLDGTGADGRVEDVAVDDGKIVARGQNLDGETTLDADGAVVSPGFIDVHTHYDAQVFWDPTLSPSCYHGVTTVVSGNCGFSLAPARPEDRPLLAKTLERVEDMNIDALNEGIIWDFETFPQYLDSIERKGSQLNFSAFLGHTALRVSVLGRDAFEREATEEEIATMCRVLKEGLEAGATGFATSFGPTHFGVDGLLIPSRVATEHEVEMLLRVVADHGRGVIGLVPGEPFDVERLYEIQPDYGIPFTYGGLLTSATGEHRRRLELHNEAWERGVQVWPQVSPRPLVFASSMRAPFVLNANPAFQAVMDAPTDERRRAYADPAFRRQAAAAFEHKTIISPRWDRYEIAESQGNPQLVGRSVQELADERGIEPLDVLLDLALDEPELDLRVRIVVANDDEADVTKLLQADHCTLGLSDAGAHGDQLCDASQATDFLGRWVREREVVDLPTAVRKLSAQQADIFGFSDRGYIREGLAADLVVFSPDDIGPGPVVRLHDFPGGTSRLSAPTPTGVRHVLVNGTPVRVDEQPVSGAPLPGQVLRPTKV
jgi:N-acyl-D-aspartate/D-glutamate deacylase